MVFTVARDRRMVSGILVRSEDNIVTMAVSIAISLPFPIAMLKSACANAALSLIPSPTIATFRPFSCNCLMKEAFSWG